VTYSAIDKAMDLFVLGFSVFDMQNKKKLFGYNESTYIRKPEINYYWQ